MGRNSSTFLLADDDPSTRAMVRRIVQHIYPDLVIREACDGEEALGHLDASVRCVLTDVCMPRMDGYQLCWSIRNSTLCRPYREVPVVLMSALYCDEEATYRAWNVGTALLLRKPFRFDELVRILRCVSGLPAPEPGALQLGAPRARSSR